MEMEKNLSDSEVEEALDLMALSPPEEHLREMLEGLHIWLQKPRSDLGAERCRRGVRILTACLEACLKAKTSHVPGQTGA